MLSLSLQIDRRKGFLSSVEQLSIKAELSGEVPIPLFVERLLARFPESIPHLRNAPGIGATDSDISETTVIDLRGRPPETLPEAERVALQFHDPQSASPRAEEEIFYSQGTIFQPPAVGQVDAVAGEAELIEQEEEDIEPEAIPFFFRLVSRFDSFKGDSHIVHRVIPRASGVLHQLLPHLSGRLLTRMVPLELDKVRMGLESYKTAGLGSLIGRAPIVQSRLYIEVTKESITIEAHRDGSKRDGSKAGTELPFAEQSLLAGIDATLRDCGLYENLSDKISEKLQQKTR